MGIRKPAGAGFFVVHFRFFARQPVAMTTQAAASSLAALLIYAVLTCFARSQDATVLEIENIVQTAAGSQGGWTPAVRNQTLAVGDRIRTQHRSRATVGLTEFCMIRLNQFTTIEITRGLVSAKKPTLDLIGGAAFIFSRERNGEMNVRMPSANAALRGTQLFAQVLPGGKSLIQVLEGRVELNNPAGRLVLEQGESGEAVPGQAPRRTAVIEAKNILQWALYYPAVLDPADPHLPDATTRAAAKSLTAYRRGDLLGAVKHLPAQAADGADGRLYHAGVLLAVGRVDEARELLVGVPRNHPGRRALERMIAAVLLQPAAAWPLDSIQTASEALAESYYLQSLAKLEPARLAAVRATALAPRNGFAWTRLAELEFSQDHGKQARAAIDHGLTLTPDNARAYALRGFILSSENRIAEARAAFENSVRLDGGFGNGWLGLGLTKIKKGDLEGGRADLQTAATVEPTSSIFHSYLGKAMSQDGRKEEAAKDLKLARILDPNDPTPMLYSAIENQQNNRTNTAIAELEESIRLNDNRRIYRSEFLLDQDRAVRSANLAIIYQNAGMKEVAVREATRAVENDYTNSSAHLFLANSFDALRDPDRTQLRYETPWFNELLLANLLSPVGGGPLSQFVSQQEYSKLLEADRTGGSITTDFRSNGDLRTTASVFGTHGNVSYGIDYYDRTFGGGRTNSDMNLQEIYAQLKWQVTPDDICYFLGKWAMQKAGDNFQTYNNQPLSPFMRFRETQEPGLLLAGWNHRWRPGSNTLFLGGRLSATQDLTDPQSKQLLLQRDPAAMSPGFVHKNGFFDEYTDPALKAQQALADPSQHPVSVAPDGNSLVYSPALLRAIAPYIGTGQVTGVGTDIFNFASHRQFEIYTAELQQIEQRDHNTFLAGARWQTGQFNTYDTLSVIRPDFNGGFSTPAADQHSVVDFQRTSLYAYDYWSPFSWITLIGGVSWDRMDHPDNFRNPPVNDNQRHEQQLSGKFGFTISPSRWFNLRGAYAEGLGGVSFDESVRLEPSQVAGFSQAYRTILSESIAGSVEAPRFKTWGLGIDGMLPSRTWWGASVKVIGQDVDRTLGAFSGYDLGVFPNSPAYFPDGTSQRLDYRECSFGATLNQLLGDEFALGLGYQITRSKLDTAYPELPANPVLAPEAVDQATLHQFSVFGTWNSPSGWFARAEANWFSQNLQDDPRGLAPGAPPRAGDAFWQFNALLGYRFWRNQGEVSLGVLNIANTDYQLSPLNPYGEIVRGRTAVMTCRLSF